MRFFKITGIVASGLLGLVFMSGCAIAPLLFPFPIGLPADQLDRPSGAPRGPYDHPDSVVLESPLPGQALLYLLRVPYDSAGLDVMSNGKRLARLPAASYVALTLSPGKHQIISVSSSSLSSQESVAEPLDIELKADQRAFYYVGGSSGTSVGSAGVRSGRAAGAVPLRQPEETLRGRIWRECTEVDARGLITISRQVLPEP